MNKNHLLKLAILLASLFTTISGIAQQSGAGSQRTITSADYARAEKLLGYNVNPLVSRSGVRPNWLPDERFWYRITTAEGSEFVLVDPARGTRAPAFDHARLAMALSAAAGTTYDAHHLPFTTFELSADGQTVSFTVRQAVSFTAGGRRWKCDLQANKCTAEADAAGQRGGG